MSNVTKLKRDEMIKFLEELKNTHTDDSSIRAFNEIENALTEKKFGLVFEEHTEEVDERLLNEIPVFCADETRKICKDTSLPYNFIIEGDNLQALYLLEKTHRGRVDCIYIDPPYNTGARDWKYNNDYVDANDNYRHSKWLSMMKTRLQIAKRLLNPNDSVLICTIDEKEYLHLGCLLEEMFPEGNIQMVSSVIKSGTSMRQYEFSRCNEYIFYLRFGKSIIEKEIPETFNDKIPWRPLMRSGTGSNNFRPARPNSFYPIYINKESCKVELIGNSLDINKHPKDVECPSNCIAVWPLKKDGTEMVWGASTQTLKEYLNKGYAKIEKSKNGNSYSVKYITKGVIKDIELGKLLVEGLDENGGIFGKYLSGKAQMPQNQWNISTHNATQYGTNLLKEIIGQRFTFPKSLYAVKDCLNHVLKNKKNAVIIDFFAGSGTTGHAVSLLNAEDGGNRKYIMITNNEISEEEIKFTVHGITPTDEEWCERGIARYVTWPRTFCSINGIDINGKPLEGDYGVEVESYIEDEDSIVISKSTGKPTKTKVYKKSKIQLYPNLKNIKKSDGFMANVKYFKCDWTPRKPENYLLSNILCLHVKEMIELENAIEIDNEKNVIIFNKDDFKKYILESDKYNMIERLWVNQNVIFDSEELKMLSGKKFKYIPREYFGQELKEATE